MTDVPDQRKRKLGGALDQVDGVSRITLFEYLVSGGEGEDSCGLFELLRFCRRELAKEPVGLQRSHAPNDTVGDSCGKGQENLTILEGKPTLRCCIGWWS